MMMATICTLLMAIIGLQLGMIFTIIRATEGTVLVMGTLAGNLSGQLEQVNKHLVDLETKYTRVNNARARATSPPHLGCGS